LLDPFAGTGTALLEAQLQPMDSLGFEPHRFFADMARAKLSVEVAPNDVDHIRAAVLESIAVQRDPKHIWGDSALKFLEKLLPANSLSELAACPTVATTLPDRIQPLFRLIVSRVLELASFSSTDGIYKAPTTRKRAQPVHTALETVCAMVSADLQEVDRSVAARVIESSAAEGVPDGVSVCVTSPPYLNNFDFAEMTRMELYFWGWAQSWSEITKSVREKLLVNTTTAPGRRKGGPDAFAEALPPGLREAAERLYSELAPACAGRSKDYHRLVFPYLTEIDAVVQRIHAAMITDATIHVIVADSALYGIHVPLHEFVALSLREGGFEQVSVKHLRQRGDRWILAKRKGPPGKLGEYWIAARK
jgi:hypothetical protein